MQENLDPSTSASPAKKMKRNHRRRTLGQAANGGDDLDLVDDEKEANEEILNRPSLAPESQIANLAPTEILLIHQQNLAMIEKGNVNAKNAFEMNIEATISTILGQSNDDAFEVYGKGVEASSKIYGYRVENVHQEANRVAGSFKRGVEDRSEGAENDRKAKARVKSRAGKTIEETVEKLNIDGLSAEDGVVTASANNIGYEDDALFRQVVSKYDEGGSLGLLLNNVFTVSDANPYPRLHCLSDPAVVPAGSAVDEVDSGFLDWASSEAPASGGGVPDLSGFRFTGWEVAKELARSRRKAAEEEEEDEDRQVASTSQQALNCSQELVTNEDVVKAFLLETTQCPGRSEDMYMEEGDFDDVVYNDDDEEEVERQGGTTSRLSGGVAGRPSSSLSICSRVSNNVGDASCSYFDNSTLENLKGAEHWKIKQKKALNNRKLPRVPKKKKEATADPLVEFVKLDNFKKDMETATGAHRSVEDITVSAKAWGKAVNEHRDKLADPGLAYSPEQFQAFLTRPTLSYVQYLEEMASETAAAAAYEDEEDNEDALGFENYRPEETEGGTIMGFGDSVMDDRTLVDGPSAVEEKAALARLSPLLEEPEDGEERPASTRSSAGATPQYEGNGDMEATQITNGVEELEEDGLIKGPARTNVPQVGCSRKICRVSVARLKREMWKTMTKEEPKDAEEPGTSAEAAPPLKLSKDIRFTELMRTVPRKAILPEKVIHASTALTVFLHMCNERQLELGRPDGVAIKTAADVKAKGWGALDDFTITQGHKK